jgi:hypothetical protein
MEVLPQISIEGSSVVVQNVRDFRHTAQGTRSTAYLDRTYQVDRIERVWFVEEPFTIPPFSGFQGVAHTYFVFDFEDQPPLTISVEARREKGETYGAIQGLFNQFELIYVWATEEDQTVRRVAFERNRLYMYPLTIPAEAARELFLQLARASQELATQPRFYNTFTSNCTNELAKAANRVRPGAIPPNRALFFPGYSDEVLYGLGFLPNDVELEELRRRSDISEIVMTSYEQPDFSRRLRAELARRFPDGRLGARAAPIRAGPSQAELDQALIQAAGNGDAEAVTRLLGQGADVTASDASGRTGLIVAAYRNHLEVARILVEAGADVNTKDASQQSAFLIATSDGYVELLRLTLGAGADVHATDSYNGTGLIRAADRGHVEIVRELLRTEMNVNHVNRLGWTALLEAIILGDGGPRHTEVVRLLLAGGADPNLADGRGISPLEHARRRGYGEMAALLESAGGR